MTDFSKSEQSKQENAGWFKAIRNPDALELIKANPFAYILASVISRRARWSDGFSALGLGPGEAMLGDFPEYGMKTERQYRTAKKDLEKWGFATFRTTNKGTIGKLTDTRLFSVLNCDFDGQTDEQVTSERRTTDEQVTTNEERIEGEKDNNEKRLIDATKSSHRQTASEKQLMARLRNILGEGEMARAGGNWRENWVRKHPGLVERGLNELELKIKEGNQIHNPAAYLVDLLKRWKKS